VWTGLGAAGVAAAGAIGGALISSDAAGRAAKTQASATGRAVDATQQQYTQTRSDLAPYRSAGEAALSRLQQLMGLSRGPGGAQTGPIARDQFDAQSYLKANPDVAQNSGYATDPYSHYVDHGMAEGRQGFKLGEFAPTSDSPLLRKFTSEDLNADPVYNSGLQFGLDEGRKAIERRANAPGGSGNDSGATLKALTRFGNDYGSQKAEGAYGRFVGNQGDIYGRLSGVAGMGAGATTVGVNAGSNTASNLASLYTGQGNAAGAATLAGANAISGGLSGAANAYGQQSMLQQLMDHQTRLAQLSGGGARSSAPDAGLMGPGARGM
jgi:hypothetical protein